MSDTNLGGIEEYMPRGLMEWAPVIGAGAASGGTVLARMFAPAGSWFARNAEMTGVLVSSAVAGALAISEGTRPAAAQVFFGGLAAGLPQVFASWVAKPSAVAGVGYYAAETANPMLGQVQANQLNGLGYATASPTPHAYGTVPGVAGAGAMAGPMQDRGMGAPVNLLGPATHHMNLAQRYGATHMG